MSLRNIRKDGDDILLKKSRAVDTVDKRVVQLLDDLRDTMHDANGYGLAAPQVGILRKVAVVDIGDGIIELINPKIVYESGSNVEGEGCLSYPGLYGEVERPDYVKVRTMDRGGNEVELIGEGLLARAFCHEIDHLEGRVFTQRVIRYIDPEENNKNKKKPGR